MTKEEFKDLMTIVVREYKTSIEVRDILADKGCYSIVYNNNNIISELLYYISKHLQGNTRYWLDWWVYDTRCGTYDTTYLDYKGKLCKCNTINQLWYLINKN